MYAYIMKKEDDIDIDTNKDWEKAENILTDVSLLDIYKSQDVGDHKKSLAFSLKFQSEGSTLKDTEDDEVMIRQT